MASNSYQPFADWPSLPEHLWLSIFSKCRAMDLLIIRDVCVDWRRIASDFSLTSHLDLRSEDSPRIQLKSLIDLLILASNNLWSLKIDGNVEILSMRGEPPTDDHSGRSSHKIIMSVLRTNCERLRRLSFKNCDVMYLPYDSLPRNLTHLSLVNCNELCLQLFEVGCPQSSCTSFKFNSVVYLNLSRVLEFDSSFCQSFNRFFSLKYLYLEQLFRINDGGISLIKPPIISKLVAIDLEGTDIKDESFEYILTNGNSLEDLFLNKTQISGTFNLRKSVAKNLKRLCLLNTEINVFNLRAILETHPSLQSVNCNPTIRQMIDSVILTTKQSTSDTCLHYLTDNRFDKSN